ncbi:hypothetical protein [Amycolatopsis sp. H20-H5]|uniref:hypothetical protein n=1 Tax=Amycolatopsis sp. H20-H5 TaxID=3046309 RepID=UPI002DC0110F|nr:hypothetical protein [Amycolatopsis sp. H20-H5]MEC3979917.1 hypothetical protein [Amycolatopsis sp. H20-H5]
MSGRKMRFALTVLAVMLPGPWTPVILLVYVLGRANEPDNPTHHAVPDPVWSRPNPDPNPYACPRS